MRSLFKIAIICAVFSPLFVTSTIFNMIFILNIDAMYTNLFSTFFFAICPSVISFVIYYIIYKLLVYCVNRYCVANIGEIVNVLSANINQEQYTQFLQLCVNHYVKYFNNEIHKINGHDLGLGLTLNPLNMNPLNMNAINMNAINNANNFSDSDDDIINEPAEKNKKVKKYNIKYKKMSYDAKDNSKKTDLNDFSEDDNDTKKEKDQNQDICFKWHLEPDYAIDL